MQTRTVVHVSSAHPHTDNRIHYRECVSLMDAGYQVTLIACEGVIDGSKTGVRIRRIPRRSRLKRMIFSTFQVAWLALRSKAEVVHLHDPELIPYIPLLRLAGRTVVYDAHEDLPAQVLDKPYTNRWTRTPMKMASRAILAVARQADLVVAATETIAKRFPAEKTVVVRNFPPLRKEEEGALSNSFEREQIAIYIGAMSASRGTIELLKVVTEPDFPAGWTLHLAGPVGEDVADLVAQAAESDRVVYHGQLPPLAVRDLLLKAKVGIVTLRNTAAYRDSLPTKLFEYFAAGLPSVASDFPLWRQIIEEADGGVLVDETSPAAIAQQIASYAASPEVWTRHSVNARKAAVTSLNWARESTVLTAAYQRL